MDEEELRLDIAEGIGKATAALSIQAALVAILVTNHKLSREDVATLAGTASASLDQTQGLPEDAKTFAESALRGFAKSWSTLVTQH